MKPKIREILLKSPSGKAEEWLARQKDIEWGVELKERPAKESLVKELVPERKQGNDYFKKRMVELRRSKAFVDFMESCNRCGICIDKCQYFISTGDVNNSPVGRANLARKLYRKGNRLKESKIDINKLYSYYYQCSECRRCSYFCPQGIDQAEITRNVRDILTEMGEIPDYVAATLAQVYKTGNNMGLNPKAIGSAVDFVREELVEETGKDIDIPLDKKKASILFIPSSADIIVNNDTLKGYTKVMHALKKDWTISTKTAEAANFGTFASEKILRDLGDIVVEEAIARGASQVVWGECGHGWRTANNYVRYRLAEKGIALQHIHQLTWKAIDRGQIRVNKNSNDDLYNYHDPCNLARGGNLVNEPRMVLNAVVRETVEAEFNKEKTFCCGAGGGLLADEKDWNDARAWAGWPAVYYSWKTGAGNMVSPCAIDKAQFPFVMDYHNIKMKAMGLMDLVGYAIEV